MSRTLLEVLAESNIELKPSSSDRLVARCPFHDNDDEPSFTVYPNHSYYCFGCGVWGDAAKFLVDYKGMSAQEAYEYVGEEYKQPKVEKNKVIKVRNTVLTWSFLWDVANEYYKYLQEMPGAKNYILSRGLTEETIRKYKIGYTDGKVLNLQYASDRQLADEVGLMTRSGYETMSHRITIPNLMERDQCDFLMGRTVINDKVKYFGTRMPKPLMGFYEVRHSPVIFLVEGQFDWLTLRQWGFPAICVSGTNLKTYSRLPLIGKEIVVVPDIDDSNVGMKTALSIKKSFGDKGSLLDITSLKTENGKLDINTLATQANGEDRFNELVRKELPWISFLSKTQLAKWFPKWRTTMYSQST